jgi:membrane-bound ClpP family serine protease
MDDTTLGYILIGVAFLLLTAELSVPTHGILIATGIFVAIIGVGMVFYYGGRYKGFITLTAVSLALPLFAAGVFYLWPRTPMGRRLIMKNRAEERETLANLPAIQGLEVYRGRIGKAVSTLRPSGVVEFDGHRIDCLSEGMLIDPNTWVKCIDVKRGKVIVRPIEGPTDLGDLENLSLT